MILTHQNIIDARADGRITIEPFNPELVSINSVDVRLGHQLWHLNRSPYRDLYKADSNWTKVEPVLAKDIRTRYGYIGWAEGIVPDEAEVFVLKSGEFYLATTLEEVGTAPNSNLVPEMKAKSTVGRQGLTVALCAGLGDIGYSSQWALEVRVTDDGNVPLAVGTPIAQIIFHEAAPTTKHYNGEDRYQHNGQVRFLPKPLKHVDV